MLLEGAVKPDIAYKTACRNVISIEHTVSTNCCFLTSYPFRERILYGLVKNI